MGGNYPNQIFYINGETISPSRVEAGDDIFGNKRKRILHFCSVLLCINSIATIVVPITILTYRNYYMYLIDFFEYSDVVTLIFISGILGLVNIWLSTILRKQNVCYLSLNSIMFFLFMFLVLLTLSTTIHILMAYQNQIDFDWIPNFTNNDLKSFSNSIDVPDAVHVSTLTPILKPGIFRTVLNSTLFESELQYGFNARHRAIWDDIQSDLKCCGVNGPNEWLQLHDLLYQKNIVVYTFPKTCFSMASGYMNTYQNGCLDLLAYNYYTHLTLLIASNVISFVIHTFVFIVYACYYFLK